MSPVERTLSGPRGDYDADIRGRNPTLREAPVSRFQGRTALVTGAASGLGRAVAAALAREGAARLVLVDRDAEGLRDVAREAGDRAVPQVCDVADASDVARAFAASGLDAGLDVLVTAAGVLGPAVSVAACEPAEFDRVFAVNVRGTYLAVRHAVPLLRLRGGGAIVTFASTAGLAGSATLGPYSASKGAVVLMTRSLALAHAGENIRVNCVCPGSIETAMLDATFAAAGDAAAVAARRAAFRNRHPLGRFGVPDEVAQTVLFLASDAAAFITGVALPVDGGRLA
jgi:NAD(P)-dependent dehydrogenase (short-subunit alcohol dehydrogenase family)